MNDIEFRRDSIMRYLQDNKMATVKELMELVHFSEATIKRDLILLEKDGLIRRTRGGAVKVDAEKIDVPYLMKLSQGANDDEKYKLARVASELIRDDMVIFIDSSTTCLHLVNLLNKFKGIKVVTNGLLSAVMLAESTTARVSVLGGKIVNKRATINGSKTFEDILTYNADIAFISCRGINLRDGATEIYEGEAAVKHAFRRQSTKVALLVSESKFNNTYMFNSSKLNEIDYLITDKMFNEEELNILENNNIELLTVK